MAARAESERALSRRLEAVAAAERGSCIADEEEEQDRSARLASPPTSRRRSAQWRVAERLLERIAELEDREGQAGT